MHAHNQSQLKTTPVTASRRWVAPRSSAPRNVATQWYAPSTYYLDADNDERIGNLRPNEHFAPPRETEHDQKSEWATPLNDWRPML